MNLRTSRCILSVCFLAAMLPLLFSCEKDPDAVGLEVTPVQDQLYAESVDTFSIQAYTVAEDSLASSFTSLNLCGSHFDPVFGRVTAGFAAQVRLSSVNPSFGDNPVPDSLVLVLAYNSYYGDTGNMQMFKVFELDEILSTDTTYYSNHRVQHLQTDYAHYAFFPRPTDSVPFDTLKLAPQLRINLSKVSPALAYKILYTPSDYLADNLKFVEYFKGLYVTAAPVSCGGSILYFNLLSSNTRLKLYYHNDEKDSLVYNLVINEACQRFNHFNHYNYDYASQDFRRQVVYGDTSQGMHKLFLQGMAGTKVKLRIPGMKAWAAGRKIAINDARLIIPGNEADPLLTPVSKMLLVKINADGSMSNLPDYAVGDSYFGGGYNSASNDYIFRLTQHVQDMLKESHTDYGLYLMASGAVVRANRFVLNGPGNPVKPLKLRVVYSLVP